MELFRNIFFNTDKIVEGANIKVTYAGYLFQNGSQNVTVHCGYGPDWKNGQDIQMQKTDLGFQANINVAGSDTLNFCFKNENEQWDNNGGANYIFGIDAADEYAVDACDCGATTNVVADTDASVTVATDDTIKVADIQNAVSDVAGTNNTNNTTKSLTTATPTWTELIKRTWSNFVNYISKLFSGKKSSTSNTTTNNK